MTRKEALSLAQCAIGQVHRVVPDGWGYNYMCPKTRLTRTSTPRSYARAVRSRTEHVAAEAAILLGCTREEANWYAQCATYAPRASGKLAYVLMHAIIR